LHRNDSTPGNPVPNSDCGAAAARLVRASPTAYGSCTTDGAPGARRMSLERRFQAGRNNPQSLISWVA